MEHSIYECELMENLTEIDQSELFVFDSISEIARNLKEILLEMFSGIYLGVSVDVQLHTPPQ